MLSQITAENSQAVYEQLSGAGSLLWKAASSYAGSLMAPSTASASNTYNSHYGKYKVVVVIL